MNKMNKKLNYKFFFCLAIRTKHKMNNIDLSKFVDLVPEKFINEGQVFEFVTKFEKGDTNISVVSNVIQENGIYKLIIKGNYKRGSTAEVSIGNQNSSIEQMYIIATTSMSEIIPIMITEDYPDSLRKVAEDEKKAKHAATTN